MDAGTMSEDSNPCIITVAITGSVPRKEHNPAVPTTIAEQVESTAEAYAAGASVVHVHVRQDDQSPTSDPALLLVESLLRQRTREQHRR